MALNLVKQNPAAIQSMPELKRDKQFIFHAIIGCDNEANKALVDSFPDDDEMKDYASNLSRFKQLENQISEPDKEHEYSNKLLEQIQSEIPLKNIVEMIKITALMVQRAIESHQGHPSTLRTIGKIMMALGALVTLAGIAAVACMAPAVSIPVLAGGVLTSATGFGFFCKQGTGKINLPAQNQDQDHNDIMQPDAPVTL